VIKRGTMTGFAPASLWSIGLVVAGATTVFIGTSKPLRGAAKHGQGAAETFATPKLYIGWAVGKTSKGI